MIKLYSLLGMMDIQYIIFCLKFRLKDSSDLAYASDDDLLFTLDNSALYSYVKIRAGISGGGYIYAGGDDDDLELNKKYAVKCL